MQRLRPVFAATPDTLPERIGAYQILGEIGRDGMGAVYCAEQREPHREVALKVLAGGLAGAAARARLAQEARAFGRLQHAGIAQVHAVDTWGPTHGSQPFLVMELVRGEPLHVFAVRTRPDVAMRVRPLVAIADAVHHAHQGFVIHRDIEPGDVLVDVLVDVRGHAKVLDSGVARLADEVPLDVRKAAIPRALQHIAHEVPLSLGVRDRRLRGDLATISACALHEDPARAAAAFTQLGSAEWAAAALVCVAALQAR